MTLEFDQWYVERYHEQMDKWYLVTNEIHSRGSFTAGPWPFRSALYIMLDDYKRWKNQYSQYHVRLRHANTGEVIPREVFA